jgi:hypothetical protein
LSQAWLASLTLKWTRGLTLSELTETQSAGISPSLLTLKIEQETYFEGKVFHHALALQKYLA